MSVIAWKRPIQCTIIGGGISGMTFAYFLEKFCRPGSINIRILERNDRLGGWINTKQVAVKDLGRDHLFFVGARTASLQDTSSAILLSIVHELEMVDDVLLSHKESIGANDRYIFYNGKLVDMPLRPTLTNLPYILKPIPMPKPYGFGYYLKMAHGLYTLTRMSTDSYMDHYRIDNFDDKTLDEIFKKAFTSDLIKYTLEPMVQGICGCRPDELSAAIFFREFGVKFFHKVFRKFDFNPFYGKPMKAFQTPFHDNILEDKNVILREVYYANKSDEKQAIDYRLYQYLYYNKFELWTLKYGFCSLIEEIASYLSNPSKNTLIELNTEVTRISPSNIDVRHYYARQLENRKKGSIMKPLKETAVEILTNCSEVVDSDIVVSSLPLYQLKRILPNYDLAKAVPTLEYTSHVTISVLYWKKAFKKPVTGFGFIVPYDQQHIVPVSGCIFDHGIISHTCSHSKFYRLNETDLNTYGFTFIIRKEVLLKNNINPFDENDVFKSIKKTMKIIFDIDQNPIAHSFEYCDRALPMFSTLYLKKYSLFKEKINELMPNLHLIGSSEGVYSINALSIISLRKAFQIAADNHILDSNYKTSDTFD